jgi:serine/threonine-protein kinase
VPDVRGMSLEEASAALEAKGFEVRDDRQFSDDVPVDRVIGTDPATGAETPYGATVTVHVSKGPDLVVVPDVVDLTVEDATAALDRAGLRVGDVKNYRPGARVRSQSEEPGTKIKRGSVVDLTLRGGGTSLLEQLFGG